ncbi:MAG: HTTM domain-containing protein [Gemmatimonadota bacterium]
MTRQGAGGVVPWFKEVWWETVDGRPLAAMRIATQAVFLYELLHMLPRHGYLLQPALPLQGVFVGFWLLCTAMLVVGFGTRGFAALSFACSVVYLSVWGVNYHVDYYQALIAFYLIFLDSGRNWSLDALIRRGIRGADRSIWHLPVLFFIGHLGLIYFDAGSSHLLANRSWIEGYAVPQSFLHPQWASNLGWFLANSSLITTTANWLTVVFELTFFPLFLVYLIQRARRRHLLLALGLAGMVMHAGIVLTYDIGVFGHQVFATLLVCIPAGFFAMVQNAVRGFFGLGQGPAEGSHLPVSMRTSSQAHGVWRVVTAGVLSPVLAASLLVQPPPRVVIDKGLLEGWSPVAIEALARVYDLGHGLLSLLGDHRPHNVFSERSQGMAFAFETEFHGEDGIIPRRFLFSADGGREGHTSYIRTYMLWYELGQTMGEEYRSEEAFSGASLRRFESLFMGLLERDLEMPYLTPARTVRVYYRAWETAKSTQDAQPRWGSPRVPLGEVGISSEGNELTVVCLPCPPGREGF